MSSCRQHLLTLAGHCPVNIYQHQHVIVPSTSVNIRQHQHDMAPSHLSTSAYHRPINICQHQHVVVPSTSVKTSMSCPVNICQHQHVIVQSTSVNTSKADLVGKIKILVHIWHQQINSKSFHLLFSFASLPAKPLSFSFLGGVTLYIYIQTQMRSVVYILEGPSRLSNSCSVTGYAPRLFSFSRIVHALPHCRKVLEN